MVVPDPISATIAITRTTLPAGLGAAAPLALQAGVGVSSGPTMPSTHAQPVRCVRTLCPVYEPTGEPSCTQLPYPGTGTPSLACCLRAALVLPCLAEDGRWVGQPAGRQEGGSGSLVQV